MADKPDRENLCFSSTVGIWHLRQKHLLRLSPSKAIFEDPYVKKKGERKTSTYLNHMLNFKRFKILTKVQFLISN